jgi:putative restriction endonuclease
MKDAEAEYKNPEQHYRNRNEMPKYWRERNQTINRLKDTLPFTLTEQTQIAGPRIYVKSDDEAFDLIRELSLPFITYLSAMKLRAPSEELFFYFRLFVDYFGEAQHPLAIKEEQVRWMKKQI